MREMPVKMHPLIQRRAGVTPALGVFVAMMCSMALPASPVMVSPFTGARTGGTSLLALEGSRPLEAVDSNGIDTRVDQERIDTRKATDGMNTDTDTHGLSRRGVESDFTTDGIDREGYDAEGIDEN
jgi:hypothetical protein